MNQRLSDQVLEDLGRRMASDMDRHILADVMMRFGWQSVTVDPWQHASASDIEIWVQDHCVGQHIRTGNSWVFELPIDATLFALRWS